MSNTKDFIVNLYIKDGKRWSQRCQIPVTADSFDDASNKVVRFFGQMYEVTVSNVALVEDGLTRNQNIPFTNGYELLDI